MLYNRFVYFSLVVPSLFVLAGCWPAEKKEREVRNMEMEEVAGPSEDRGMDKSESASRSLKGDVVIEIESDADFEEAQRRGKPIIADFWAEWCGPCQKVKPIFHKMAEKFSDNITFVSLNEKHKDKHNRFNEYQIAAFPTIIYLDKDGKQVEKHEGGYDEARFETAINNFIAKGRP